MPHPKFDFNAPKTDAESALISFEDSKQFGDGIAHWKKLPPVSAQYAPFPPALDPKLVEILKARGIEQPYTHQAEAVQLALENKNLVVVTPTASGKTLCYNLPVLQSLIDEPETRALYLFPTKALSRDQMNEVHDVSTQLERDIKVYTFDGDTPASARRAIRNSGHIVVTNPDMLHTGILPHHTLWVRLFENLKYVVIDEIHHYRGVFGSHLANVLRRLKRICAFYGSHPTFICCSATIANPRELASKVIGEDVELVDQSGAPQGERHFIFYNPPLVNRELGIRRSSVKEASRIALHFLQENIQTITFARSRLRVEILTTYLKRMMRRLKKNPDLIRGYRGGYLPLERREIERGIKDGSILGVVSTNALELGIDIGQLQVSVMSGYPGSVSSTWQQGGRAGRRGGVSAIILVGSSAPLDQYILAHPEYFFGASPESGIINPNNVPILVSHLRCAAFELPIEDGEAFGVENPTPALKFLEDEEVLHHIKGRWHYTSERYPAEEVSLRSANPENFVVLNISTVDNKVLGEVDFDSAPELIHEDAIYIHQSQTYFVERLDYDGRTAYVKEVEVDYYTDAIAKTDIRTLDVDESAPLPTPGWDGMADAEGLFTRNLGVISVTTLVTKYKKVKFETHESVGYGDIALPEREMQTESYWIRFSDEAYDIIPEKEMGGALAAISQALANVIPIHVMCDPRDFRVAPMVKSPDNEEASVFVYDAYPGGMGLSQRAYEIHDDIIASALELLKGCCCDSGCPSCVGPPLEVGPRGKDYALNLLGSLR
jgi:DEAD/DEAH box helicase domain-containing protein